MSKSTERMRASKVSMLMRRASMLSGITGLAVIVAGGCASDSGTEESGQAAQTATTGMSATTPTGAAGAMASAAAGASSMSPATTTAPATGTAGAASTATMTNMTGAATGTAGAAAPAGMTAAAGAAAPAGMTAAAGAAAPAGMAAAGSATWTAVYDALFGSASTAGCGACHGGDPNMALNGGFGGLKEKDAAYAALVGKMPASGMCMGKTYVTPGSPEMSLLYQKVSTTPDCGMRMPPGGMLDDASIELVKGWIMAGAMDN